MFEDGEELIDIVGNLVFVFSIFFDYFVLIICSSEGWNWILIMV